jgi:hypothetical protein
MINKTLPEMLKISYILYIMKTLTTTKTMNLGIPRINYNATITYTVYENTETILKEKKRTKQFVRRIKRILSLSWNEVEADSLNP